MEIKRKSHPLDSPSPNQVGWLRKAIEYGRGGVLLTFDISNKTLPGRYRLNNTVGASTQRLPILLHFNLSLQVPCDFPCVSDKNRQTCCQVDAVVNRAPSVIPMLPNPDRYTAFITDRVSETI